MMNDFLLSEHFTFYEMTKTSYLDLQEQNRILTPDQIQKLRILAQLAEEVRNILSVPLQIHSGYRCPQLNLKVGSTIRSQHLKCEAFDFIPLTLMIEDAFKLLRQAVKSGKLKIGQLIWEKAERSYGVTEWIHCSLGIPFREIDHCGQILTMVDGSYNLIETVPQ